MRPRAGIPAPRTTDLERDATAMRSRRLSPIRLARSAGTNSPLENRIAPLALVVYLSFRPRSWTPDFDDGKLDRSAAAVSPAAWSLPAASIADSIWSM